MFIVKGADFKSLSFSFLVILFFACFFITLNSCKRTRAGLLSPSEYNKAADTASIVYDKGQTDKAVHDLSLAFHHSKNLELGQIYKYYRFVFQYAYRQKNDRKMARRYADSMIDLFDTPQKKLKHTTEYGQAYFSKGDVLFDEKKYNEAYQYFYAGKVIGSNNLDNCILTDYSYRMGMILYKQDHYLLAAANFKNSLAESKSCGTGFNNFYHQQELMNNTGLSYIKANMPDSALYFYNQVIDYLTANAGKYQSRPKLIDMALGVVYGNKANIFIDQNNFDQAKILLKKSADINLRQGNDNNDAQMSELKLAHIYDQLNQADSLISILQTIQLQFDSVNSQEARMDWNYLMYTYFLKKNNHQKAVKYFTDYDILKDSVYLKNKALKEADIAGQIKSLEKDNEFNNLKKDNRLQNIYLKVTAVFALMLVIIISLTFLNWQKSKKNIKTLGSLNRQINDQNTDLEKALDELKLNSREKDRILRTVAHDLRNPIGGIASLTSVMADDDYTNEQKELLNLIKETSYNSIELINEILEATKSASAALVKEPVEINALLSNSVELLRFKAAEKRQTIRLEILNTPVELLINREKIWRVISNLISNAIKFSPAGASILVMALATDTTVQILVEDHGIGIPDKLKSQVFNMFTDAKRPGTAGEKSFGLGLSICQQIIEKHNGRIWFESDTENGTTFYFSLPL